MDWDYVLDRSVLFVLVAMGLIAWIWLFRTSSANPTLVTILVESVVGLVMMLVVFGITTRVYERFGEIKALALIVLIVAFLGFLTIRIFPKSLHSPHSLPILAYPIVPILVYHFFGKEKSFVVPEYLSYVPNRNRKPWFVNLVFKGDALTLDINGIVATILDLYRRGIIDLLGAGKIRIVRESDDLDDYERKLLNVIRKYSKGGIFDPKLIKACIYRQTGVITLEKIEIDPEINKKVFWELHEDISSLLVPGGRRVKSYYNPVFPVGKFYDISLLDLRGRNVFAVTLFIAVVLSLTVDPIYTILFFQSLVCYSTPTQLFGRWRDEYYKEKLEWLAFKRFLERFAMMDKYKPEDVSVWDDWLVYGTALGVAKAVQKFMSPVVEVFVMALLELT